MKHRNCKTGKYKDIKYEMMEPIGVYPAAYYIYIPIDKLKNGDKIWAKKGYMECCDLLRLPFHYGCTFTQHCIFYNGDSEYRIVKMGCDYGHYQDTGFISFESMFYEVMETIDALEHYYEKE